MHFYNEVLDLSYCACICRINLFNIELLLHIISYVIIIWGYFLLENEQFLFTLNKRNSDKCIITLIYSITCTCIKFILYSSNIYIVTSFVQFFYHLCDETCFAMLSYFVTWPNSSPMISSLKLPSCLLSLYFVNHIRTQMLLFAVLFVSAFNCDQGR